MTFRRLFIAGLLGCTVLAACDGSDEKAAKPDEAAQSTFDGMQADIGRLAETNQDLLAQIAALKKGTEAGSKETRALIVTLEARVAQQAAALKAKTEADRTLAIAGRTAGDEQGRALAKLAAELAALKTAALPQVTGDIAALKASMQTLTDGLAGLKALEARLAGLETGLAEVKGRTLTADELKAFHDLDARFVALKQDFDKALAGKADKTAIPDIAGLVADVAALKTGKADKQAVTDLQDRLAVLKADMDAAAKLSAVAAGDLAGRLDALEKDMAAVKPLPDQELTKYVNTMRGAWSTGSFTRGNTYPATAVPFGFNFWVPVNRDDGNWFYQFYDDKNDTRLLDKVLAFAVVHMPSPWIGNRQTLQIMPISDQSKTDRSNRGEKFQRSNETAQAHYYSLTFDNGTRTEIAPTDHAAYFRFTAPAGKPKQTILFDTMAGNGSLTIDEANAAVSGYTDHGSPRMYFYARFDSKPSLTRKISPAGVKSWLEFDTPDTAKVVGMRIATSFISVDQARDNLAQEIAADASFDDVKAQAQAAWNEKLNMIQVEGATEDQKTILYSNLYRSFLWPNSAFETVAGEAAYMSPYTSPPALKKGRIWVNNGFWDTYRTTWPLYTLLLPDQAGRMIDGFVNGYKDGGWVTRWSGPGYVDSMVATSSDVIFADAYRKGVRNFDADAAYASMLRNATTYSSEPAKGRKGISESVFYGYAPSNVLGRESVSWSLEGDLNDFGIAQMAKALNKPDDYAYFSNRALNYATLFDGTSAGSWAGGWFRAKDRAGVSQDSSTTPYSWGYGYTEGNAWSYAFLAPQDGQGLANLYGGRDKLKAKLDAFFTAPTYTSSGGSYGSVIHEILEARSVADLAQVGQYQHSNQTVHHSIYMYNYAGAPAAGQQRLRDVMGKLYFSGFDAKGVSNGAGYIGDEDNGEQSAWYVLSAMGFYPVSMGRPEYAIGAPYFPKMTVRVKGAKTASRSIVVNAPGVSDTNRYVQSVRLNGVPITRTYLMHNEIADGAALDFVMGPAPSNWGTGDADVPESMTKGSARPAPWQSFLPAMTYDVTASTAQGAASLFDRSSATAWASASGPAWIEASLKAPNKGGAVKLYTITSGSGAGDPSDWALKGSKDGVTWVTLDERKAQTFQWRRQTRPFALKDNTDVYSRYRLEIAGTAAVNLAEFELLGTVQP